MPISQNQCLLISFSLLVLIIFTLVSNITNNNNDNNSKDSVAAEILITTTTPRQDLQKHRHQQEHRASTAATQQNQAISLSSTNDNNEKCTIANFNTNSYVEVNTSSQNSAKVLNFNPLYTWFGLTNQMLCYAAATRYAIDEDRAVLFPDHHHHHHQQRKTDSSSSPPTAKEEASTADESKNSRNNNDNDNNNNLLIDFHRLFNASLYFDILRATIATSSLVDKDLKRRVKRHLKLAWREDFSSSPKEEKKGKKKGVYYYTPLQFPKYLERNKTVFVPASAFPFTSMNKKNLFLPNRDVYRVTSFDKIIRIQNEIILKNLNRRASSFQYTRHHNFFMRYPWVLSSSASTSSLSSSSAALALQEAHFLNSLQPHDVIEEYWKVLSKMLVREMIVAASAAASSSSAEKSTESNSNHHTHNDLDDDGDHIDYIRNNLVTLHLRLEKDAALLSKKLPSTAQELFNWLKSNVLSEFNDENHHVPFLHLYLCLGEFPSEKFEWEFLKLVQEVESEKKVKIFWRGRLLSTVLTLTQNHDDDENQRQHHRKQHQQQLILPLLPKSSGTQRESQQKSSKSTQDHFLSFVDFLFLTRSKHTIVSRYSSLKFPVFAKRCYFTPGIGEDQDENQQERDEIKSVLKCLLPKHQRIWFDDDAADSSKHILFEYHVEDDGRFSSLSRLSCKDKSVLGWAGHKSWN